MTKNTALTFTVLPGLGGERCIESWISHDIHTNYISYMDLYICYCLYICIVFYFFPENTLSKDRKMNRGPVFTTKRSIRY